MAESDRVVVMAAPGLLLAPGLAVKSIRIFPALPAGQDTYGSLTTRNR